MTDLWEGRIDTWARMLADAYFRSREEGEGLKPIDQYRAVYRSYANEMSGLPGKERDKIIALAEKMIEAKGVDILSGYTGEQWLSGFEDHRADVLKVVSIFKKLTQGKKVHVRNEFDLAVAYFLGYQDDMDEYQTNEIAHQMEHDEHVGNIFAIARTYLLISGYKVDDF